MNEVLYKDIYDFKNLLESYEECIKSISVKKRYRRQVVAFSVNVEENIIELQNDLIWKSYEMGDYSKFCVYEPKKRDIAAPTFRDRVLQTALCRLLEPYIERQFIYDSYACRKGKGTLKAARRAAYFTEKNKSGYYCKCDIHKFFFSININILLCLFRRYVKDTDVMWLIEKILRKDCNGKGLKIGNRLSQLSANVYLHELDFYVKQNLHIKHYVRYADDFIFWGKKKSGLERELGKIRNFLSTIELKENPEKTRIEECKKGLDFVGYMIYPNKVIILKRCIVKTKRLLRQWKKGKISNVAFVASIASRCGHAKGTVSYKFYNDILLKALMFVVNN